MDLNSTQAALTSLSENAAKSVLHALWTQTAAHPRLATIVALCGFVAAFGGGMAVMAGVR